LKTTTSIIVFVSFLFVAGCSDLTDQFGDYLPGFLKSKETKEEPKIQKFKPTDEVRSSAPAGGTSFTPSAMVPAGGEGKIPGKPPTGGPAVPGEKGAPEKKTPGTETAKKEGNTTTPADKTKPGTDKGEKKEPEKPPKEGQNPPKKGTETPPGGPAPAGGGGTTLAGEDIAMVALVPEAGAPTITPDKLTGGIMDKEYIYDPTGKRDPFRPFTLKVEKKAETPPEELTPLQRYNLSQLKLTAIIYDPERETGIAMVEAPDLKGYNIFVGSEIGGGRVVRITDTEVQVEVNYEDFYGNVEKRIETLKIRGGL
jgi:type IV pilus assembly protein PilP